MHACRTLSGMVRLWLLSMMVIVLSACGGAESASSQDSAAAGHQRASSASSANSWWGWWNYKDAPLKYLECISCELSPQFESKIKEYTSTVAADVTSVKLVPYARNENAEITINGEEAESGDATTVNLNPGANVITVAVSSYPSSGAILYTLVITRLGANATNNADLQALSLSMGVLDPAFNSAITSYSAVVADTVTNTTVTATTADANARVSISGQPATAGTASYTVALNFGTNLVPVVVTAADGVTTKTYNLSITRAASGDANLSALSLSSGTLNPAFSAAVTSYTANVPNTVTSVQVTAVAAAGATLLINGAPVASGTPSAPINLNVGVNNISVMVTAQDAVTTKVYTIAVQRAASSNADLSSLVVNTATITPAFAAGTTSYSAQVANSITSVTVTAATADSGASLLINGQNVPSGTPSSAIALNVGSNTVNVIVTAADSVTSKVYTITITRAASSNADLGALTLSTGTIEPAFNATTTSYSSTVANTITTTQVTATVADNTATVTINGVVTPSGTPSAAIALKVGINPVAVVVTAADGTTSKTYTINVTRTASADLTALSLSAGTLNPAFTAANTSYSAQVENAVTTINVTATPEDSDATITVNGVSTAAGLPSVPFALNVGNNALAIVVAAADGVTTKTYNVIVNRLANPNLESLTLSVGQLSPAFAPDQNTYTSQVGYLASVVRVTLTTADPAATVILNNQPLTAGVASGQIHLTEGANVLDITVTASDAVTTKNYQLTITRQDLASFAQSVYAKSSNSDTGDSFGYASAIWGDTIAVSANSEDSANSNPDDNSLGNSGAVYIFARDGNGIWTQQAYLKASNPGLNDRFGSALSLWRDTLVVGAFAEDSNATGVNGDGTNDLATDSGAAYVYLRDSNGVWGQQAYLKASNTMAGDNFGYSLAVHDNTIVVGAYHEDSNGVDSGAAYVFTRNPNGVWVQETYLKSSNSQAADYFGESVAVYGNRIVVGASGEDSAATGSGGNQLDNTRAQSGAAYVFEREPGTANWAQTEYLKASNPDANDLFGTALALWENTLVVGAPGEGSATISIPTDNTQPGAGAAYVFDFIEGGWSQTAYLKASNPGAEDNFGAARTVSLWENTLIVGAPNEDTSTRTINGLPNELYPSAGAAYVFVRDASGVWAQPFFMKAFNARSTDTYGRTASVFGDTLVVGAPFEDGSTRGLYTTPTTYGSANSGSAYIYK